MTQDVFFTQVWSVSSATIINITRMVVALINEKRVGVTIVLRSNNSVLTKTKGLTFVITSILIRII